MPKGRLVKEKLIAMPPWLNFLAGNAVGWPPRWAFFVCWCLGKILTIDNLRKRVVCSLTVLHVQERL